MPFNATQTTRWFTNIEGFAPDAATAASLQSLALQNASGAISDAQTVAAVTRSPLALSTNEVALATYQFFTGAAPSQAGLAFLRGDAGGGNPNGLNSAFYAGFNTENRYYNFALNLTSTAGQANAGFVTSFGAQTVTAFIAGAYETIVGTANVGQAGAAAAIASITASLPFLTSVALSRAGSVDAGGAAGQNIALKAVIAAYILEEAVKADVGTYARALDQFTAAETIGAARFGADMIANYSPGGPAFNTGAGFAPVSVTGDAGSTVTISNGPNGGTATVAGAFTGGTFTGGGDGVLAATGAAVQGLAQLATPPKFTGFTTLSVTDALTSGSAFAPSTVGAGIFQTVGVAAAGAASVTLASGGTVIASGPLNVNTGVLNVSVTGSAGSTTDVLNVAVSGATPSATFSVAAQGVETVNFAANSLTANAIDKLLLNDDAVTTVRVSGGSQASFVALASETALKTVDGSAATNVLRLDTSAVAATQAAPITLIGGSAHDVLNFKDFTNVTGGGGSNDLWVIAPTSSATLSSVLDEKAGDRIAFFSPDPSPGVSGGPLPIVNADGMAGTHSFVATAITLGAGATLQNYLDAGAARGAGVESWFTFGGDTYVELDVNGSANTFQNGMDSVVRLVGIHDLSRSTVVAANGFITTSG